MCEIMWDSKLGIMFHTCSIWRSSWLLPLWQESLYKTKCMWPVHSFSWKSSHFHMKCFAWALDLKKRQTATVKSAYEPSGPLGWHLSRFLWHEVTRSISTPPWIGCQSIAGIPPILNLPVSIYIPEWRETVKVKCHNTMYNVKNHNTMFPAMTQTQIAPNRKEIQKSNNRLFTQTD